jgi:deoxyribodipyrimidine photolyase-related protein
LCTLLSFLVELPIVSPCEAMSKANGPEELVLVLGDQLHPANLALEDLRKDHVVVLMIETVGEATRAWSHKQRIAVFLSAMRHYARDLEARGWQVDYQPLAAGHASLAAGLADAIGRHRPARVSVVEAGEWRVQQDVESACERANVPLRRVEDSHFYCDRDAFRRWARGRRQLVMEFFYRDMRRRFGVLMDGDQPVGGAWNFDKDNRGSFGRAGPGAVPPRARFEPDEITREVLAEVASRFADHPGSLESFAWPVTASEARAALADFVTQRLPLFGRYQDAMWQGEPWLYHAGLAAALNLKLLDPREAVAAAVAAWEAGHAPLAAVEGFVRQVLGWREFIRGIYWLHMPDYAGLNHFGHDRPLPAFFWNGETDLNCLRQSLGDTLANGYAHHIQRLMVIGNFALLAGLDPKAVCDWFLAVYVDAVEWVELPNTLGMALHADGGIVGSKPYAASGAYIKRMSNYCAGCRYDPGSRSGSRACPFNLLYWDFLARHREALAGNPRMALALKNLERIGDDELEALRADAQAFLARL